MWRLAWVAAGGPRVPAPLKTEAIVLRSIRYGEADRILHLYTPRARAAWRDRQGRPPGPQSVRRPSGAVLPCPPRPARRARRAAYRDRASTRSPPTRALRDHASTLDAAARACDALARLFDSTEPHPEVFRLLANELALLSVIRRHARPANGLAFRLKLLLAAGIMPQLGELRRLRRDGRSPRILGRRRWGRVQLVRGRCVPARRGGLPVSGGGRGQAAGAGARGLGCRRSVRRSGRSLRRPSTTPTFGCARFSAAA